MKSFSRLMAIIRKEVRQLRRDRLTFGMVVGLPLLADAAVRVCHQYRRTSISSAGLVQPGRYSPLAGVRPGAPRDPGRGDRRDLRTTQPTLEELLRRGAISVGIAIPADFDRRTLDENRAAVQLLVDGSDPTILGVANQLRSTPVRFDSPRADRDSPSNIARSALTTILSAACP